MSSMSETVPLVALRRLSRSSGRSSLEKAWITPSADSAILMPSAANSFTFWRAFPASSAKRTNISPRKKDMVCGLLYFSTRLVDASVRSRMRVRTSDRRLLSLAHSSGLRDREVLSSCLWRLRACWRSCAIVRALRSSAFVSAAICCLRLRICVAFLPYSSRRCFHESVFFLPASSSASICLWRDLLRSPRRSISFEKVCIFCCAFSARALTVSVTSSSDRCFAIKNGVLLSFYDKDSNTP